MTQDNPLPARNENEGSRKVYSAPKLVEYGSIAKLTQGGGATNPTDASFMTCL